jgi:hypothetical protein
MKWPAKVFLAVAVLVGIYCGASAKDHDRWIAALRLSTTSASKLRVETERDKYMAHRAAEQARWHRADKVASDTDTAPAGTLSRDVVCAGIEDREALLKSDGREPDRKLERMKQLCANL